MLERVTPEQWQRYDTDGFVKLGVALSPDELGALASQLDALMMGELVDFDYSHLLMQRQDDGAQTRGFKGPSLEYRKMQGLEHDPVVFEYMQSALFRAVAQRTYSGATAVYRTMFFNKPEASGGSTLAWHQDRWSVLDRDPRITVYLSIDAATEANGCMHVIPRSHTLGVVNPREGAAFLEHDQVPQVLSELPSQPLELRAGEIVLLSTYCLHSSGINSSNTARRALSICLMDAATKFVASGADTGATVLFGDDAHPARLGCDPETLRARIEGLARL
jgi:phytanoyl-CoA hydroxylase